MKERMYESKEIIGAILINEDGVLAQMIFADTPEETPSMQEVGYITDNENDLDDSIENGKTFKQNIDEGYYTLVWEREV